QRDPIFHGSWCRVTAWTILRPQRLCHSEAAAEESPGGLAFREILRRAALKIPMLANSTSRSGSERWHVSLDGDDIAESLKAADEAVFEADSVPLVEVQGAEVLEWLPAAEDVVDDDENRVANGKSGFLESDAWDQAVQLGCKVGLSPTGRV